MSDRPLQPAKHTDNKEMNRISQIRRIDSPRYTTRGQRNTCHSTAGSAWQAACRMEFLSQGTGAELNGEEEDRAGSERSSFLVTSGGDQVAGFGLRFNPSRANWGRRRFPRPAARQARARLPSLP